MQIVKFSNVTRSFQLQSLHLQRVPIHLVLQAMLFFPYLYLHFHKTPNDYWSLNRKKLITTVTFLNRVI